ncbi:MAG: alpha/beta fold hydrolase [Sciscionella sp.]
MLAEQASFASENSAVTAGHALVFAPHLPQWDGGRFFTPATRTLTGLGYRVTVVDTLAMLDGAMTSITELATRWSTELAALDRVDLLAGNALGGAVAQALAATVQPAHGVVVVSGPTHADDALAGKLSAIADLAAECRVAESLALLDRLVVPEGAAPAPSRMDESTDSDMARARIVGGMRLLLKVDLTAEVAAYRGRLMHLLGERSQLVTAANVAGAAHHQIVSVPGAGMRPHRDRPAAVADHITRFVKESASG